MFKHIKEGWKTALKQPFVLLILFAYRLVWGFVLYSMVQSTVVPLLHRYPGIQVSGGQTQLFLAEGQFQLMKTDFIHSYLWLLLLLLLAKMVVTPLLNAGIYYSLRQTHLNSGYRFFKGIRELGVTFFFYYLIQMILTLAPLYNLLPKWGHLLLSSDYKSASIVLLPYISIYLLYGYILHLSFMYLQFGKTWTRSWIGSLHLTVRRLFPIVGISLALIFGSFLLAALSASVVWIWASFWTLILYQAYRFIQTLFDLWGISAQHQLYTTETNF
ncbi:MAG: hypothetical protein JWM44_914 [Bacilli bacterium]|nr:hypothetical protein [Bacilli bacterium]